MGRTRHLRQRVHQKVLSPDCEQDRGLPSGLRGDMMLVCAVGGGSVAPTESRPRPFVERERRELNRLEDHMEAARVDEHR